MSSSQVRRVTVRSPFQLQYFNFNQNMNSIIIIFIISSISIIKSLPLPQSHGIPNLLLIAINQISSQGSYTFGRVEDLLINTISQQTDFLGTSNEPLTFIAPTDDAFDDYLARQNTSLQTLASGNESVKLMECKLVYLITLSLINSLDRFIYPSGCFIQGNPA